MISLTLASVVAPVTTRAEHLALLQTVLFYLFAFLAAGSAWAIVCTGNVVRMSLYLLTTLAAVAGLYFLLNAEFLAAIQLIVYAGGTLILIVFGIMLTTRDLFDRLAIARWEWWTGLTVSLLTMALLAYAALLHHDTLPSAPPAPALQSEQVNLLGRALLSTHLVAFEALAVILLVVMVAAAAMARRTEKSSS